MKLQVQRSRLDIFTEIFFLVSVLFSTETVSLPQSVVHATSVTSVKRQLYKIWALKALPIKLIDVKLKLSSNLVNASTRMVRVRDRVSVGLGLVVSSDSVYAVWCKN